MKYYWQQIRYQFSTQPLLMGVTMVGTALSIVFIMIFLMMQQIYILPVAPELNRDRSLHIKSVSFKNWGSGYLGAGFVEECITSLKTPECVAVYTQKTTHQALLPGKTSMGVEVKGTNAGFWSVFNFTFLAGGPYQEEEVASGNLKAVIDETVARNLWGKTEVLGLFFELDYLRFQVVGVVRPVSAMATFASSQVWVPYSVLGKDRSIESGGVFQGNLWVTILAREKGDFEAIRAEFEDRIALYNKEKMEPLGSEIFFRGQPDIQADAISRKWTNMNLNSEAARKEQILIVSLLLLIPALTLSGMLHSRLRFRVSEIGIRRSFGAPRKILMYELLTENLLITLLGGAVGLILCILVAYLGGMWIFPKERGIDLPVLLGVLFHWKLFFCVWLICLLLNLFAGIFPIWKVMGKSISGSINSSYE